MEGDRTSILESHPDLKNCRQVEKEVLKLLRDYLPYSQAQYGLEGSADNKKAQLQSNLTNTCGAKATLVWDEHDAAPNKAAFFVCTLGEDEAVVSICGTHTLQDWITDAQAWGELWASGAWQVNGGCGRCRAHRWLLGHNLPSPSAPNPDPHSLQVLPSPCTAKSTLPTPAW